LIESAGSGHGPGFFQRQFSGSNFQVAIFKALIFRKTIKKAEHRMLGFS